MKRRNILAAAAGLGAMTAHEVRAAEQTLRRREDIPAEQWQGLFAVPLSISIPGGRTIGLRRWSPTLTELGKIELEIEGILRNRAGDAVACPASHDEETELISPPAGRRLDLDLRPPRFPNPEFDRRKPRRLFVHEWTPRVEVANVISVRLLASYVE